MIKKAHVFYYCLVASTVAFAAFFSINATAQEVRIRMDRMLADHDNTVFTISTQRGGARMLSGGVDKQVILWNTKSWKPLAINQSDVKSRVLDSTFSADGKYAVTATDPQEVLVLELPSLTLVRKLRTPFRCVRVALSPSQPWVAIGGYIDSSKVLVKNYLTGEKVADVIGDGSELFGVWFSSDGNFLYTAGGNKHKYWLRRCPVGKWDASQRIAELPSMPMRIEPSEDGKSIGIATKTQAIVFDLQSGQPTHHWEAPPGVEFDTAVFWNAHNVVLTGDSDGRLRIWKPGVVSPLAEQRASAGKIYEVAILNQGQVVTCGRVAKDAIRVWNVEFVGEPTGPPKHPAAPLAGGRPRPMIGPKGQTVLVYRDGRRVTRVDGELKTFAKGELLPWETGQPTSPVESPDQAPVHPSNPKPPPPLTSPVTPTPATPKPEMPAIAHTTPRVYPIPTEEFESLAFLPDRKRLAVSYRMPGNKPGGYFLELATGKKLADLPETRRVVTSMIATDDGRSFYTVEGNLVRHWDANTGQSYRTLATASGIHGKGVMTPRGDAIMFPAGRGVEFFRADLGMILFELKPPPGTEFGQASTRCVALAPKGQLLAAGADAVKKIDGTIINGGNVLVWNLPPSPNKEPLKVLKGHAGDVKGVSWSAQGLVSVDTAGAAIRWNERTGDPLHTHSLAGPQHNVWLLDATLVVGAPKQRDALEIRRIGQSADGRLAPLLVSLALEEIVAKQDRHQRHVKEVLLSPDRNTLAVVVKEQQRDRADTFLALYQADKMLGGQTRSTAAATKTTRPAAFRTWTSQNGMFEVEAAFVKFVNGVVHLRRKDNSQIIQVRLDLLSTSDQKHLREQR